MAGKKSSKQFKNLPKNLSGKEASSVKGGVTVKKGSLASTRSDEAPKENITFEYGGLQIKY